MNMGMRGGGMMGGGGMMRGGMPAAATMMAMPAMPAMGMGMGMNMNMNPMMGGTGQGGFGFGFDGSTSGTSGNLMRPSQGMMGMGMLDPDFWADAYTLRDDIVSENGEDANAPARKVVPAFLAPVAEMVLGAGKGIGLLRALAQRQRDTKQLTTRTARMERDRRHRVHVWLSDVLDDHRDVEVPSPDRLVV